MKYQFTLDNRPAAPARTSWEGAARDAVMAGYAVWVSEDRIKLDGCQGAAIMRVDEKPVEQVKVAR